MSSMKQDNPSSFLSSTAFQLTLVVIVAALVITSQVLLSTLSGTSTSYKSSSTKKFSSTGDPVQDSINQVIPTGMPDVYGAELGVSFDDPVPGLNVLSRLEQRIPLSSLTPEEKQKFIEASTPISCEFCCGAPSVITSDGSPACGCAHAAAIRGLALYLVKNHPEYSADQILEETTKWKALFFPKQMVEKGAALIQNGQDITPKALNDRQLLQKLNTGDLSGIGNLPNMVGGC